MSANSRLVVLKLDVIVSTCLLTSLCRVTLAWLDPKEQRATGARRGPQDDEAGPAAWACLARRALLVKAASVVCRDLQVSNVIVA